ncbi:MAG: TnpV protein, partial [Oscillospiraceae bacterium]|nr:TnpV protein [Oscillospiraceae bacterium]
GKYGSLFLNYLRENHPGRHGFLLMETTLRDVALEVDREAALYVVLRYCLGYSAYEIACGMGVSYARVKHSVVKVRRHVEQRDARVNAR